MAASTNPAISFHSADSNGSRSQRLHSADLEDRGAVLTHLQHHRQSQPDPISSVDNGSSNSRNASGASTPNSRRHTENGLFLPGSEVGNYSVNGGGELSVGRNSRSGSVVSSGMGMSTIRSSNRSSNNINPELYDQQQLKPMGLQRRRSSTSGAAGTVSVIKVEEYKEVEGIKPYRPIYVGLFKQEASCQTSMSSIPDFKNVLYQLDNIQTASNIQTC